MQLIRKIVYRFYCRGGIIIEVNKGVASLKEKWLNTTDIFDEYERRFARARSEKVLRRPWEPEHRQSILGDTKQMLRFDENQIPTVHDLQEISRQAYNGYDALQLRYQTWEGMYGASTLYLPRKKEKLPLVFVCCGHGEEGRLTPSYMAMGHRLAELGMAALVMDNIGQGDRNPEPEKGNGPDHWFAVAPFQCGLTLQGMIVMETVAMIRHMQQDSRFDPARFGACGNSGGGTLTMFLAALAPELSAIASCGYPSEITYVLQKERRHCACNLLVGQAYGAEMWEIYSLFAPKPLLLEGGSHDNLIPMELANRNSRKVRNTYVQLGAEANFHFKLTNTRHSWELEDINLVSGFLAQHLLGKIPGDADSLFMTEEIGPLRVPIPENCLTTAQLSEKISGKTPAEGKELADVFPPTYWGEPIDFSQLQKDVGRGDIKRVFAQFECTLYQPE